MPIGTKKFETNQLIAERRKWQVFPRTTRRGVEGVKVDGKPHRFNKQGFFETDDQGLAHAIHDSSGQGGTGDVLVIPTEKPMSKEHTRTFTVSISFDENGRIMR
jgi:hypothetical protein